MLNFNLILITLFLYLLLQNLQALAKVLTVIYEGSLGMFYHNSWVPPDIIIWCHSFFLSPTPACIWGCSVLRVLFCTGHIHSTDVLFISWRLLCWEWPSFFWTLLSFIRLFPPRFSFSWCGKFSKKPTFLLLIKYPFLLLP